MNDSILNIIIRSQTCVYMAKGPHCALLKLSNRKHANLSSAFQNGVLFKQSH